MKLSAMIRGLMVVASSFLLLFSAGCDFSRSENPPPPAPVEPPAPTDVTTTGTCTALTAGIQCIDSSRCVQGEVRVACASVDWDFFLGNIAVASRSADPETRIQVDGLTPGATYRIDQTTTAVTGEEKTEVHNVTIPGG